MLFAGGFGRIRDASAGLAGWVRLEGKTGEASGRVMR
jgi:hypothetical protein